MNCIRCLRCVYIVEVYTFHSTKIRKLIGLLFRLYRKYLNRSPRLLLVRPRLVIEARLVLVHLHYSKLMAGNIVSE